MEQVLRNIYKKYLYAESIKFNCDSKVSKKIVLLPHQLRVKDYFEEIKNGTLPQRGLLLYHGLGSGKTITSIISSFDNNESEKIIIMSPASLKQNYINEIQKLNKKNKFKIMSYNTSKIEKDLQKENIDNKIIIIDEAHNLFSMISSKSKIGVYIYERFMKGVNTKFLFLSGTPIINSPFEIALMFNVLRPGIFFNSLYPSEENFQTYYIIQKNNRKIIPQLINGLTSYFKGISDTNVFPRYTNKIIKVPMTKLQQEQHRYYQKIENVPYYAKDNKNNSMLMEKKQRNLYKVYTRQVCNFAIIKDTEKISNEELKTKLNLYSLKYLKLLNIIKKSEGPVLIYSNFKETGIDLIYRILKLNNISAIKWTGDETEAQRQQNLLKFNNISNKYGKEIKCFLITSAGSEGISLKNVRQVHIIEPHWNKNREQQVIGRALRICSHTDLPLNKRVVDIYRYYSINNSYKTTDIIINDIANAKYKIIEEFLELIKNSAFDCILTKQNKNCFFNVN